MRLDDLEQLGVRAASQRDDLGDLVTAVVEDHNQRRGLDDAAQPGKGIDGKRSLGPVIKIIKTTELVIDPTTPARSLDQKAPEVDPAIRRALDVQINLHCCVRHLDGTCGFAVEGNALQ